jgi:RNA-directed DNA polymerase
MRGLIHFLQHRLKLTVNMKKSAVDRPSQRKFLGFSLYFGKNVGIRLASQSVDRFKAKVRELTSRSRSQSIETRLQRLSSYLRGWVHYFALADALKRLTKLDEWVRRRLRLCLWKQWKRAITRFRNLRKLGLPEFNAWEAAGSKKGLWRLSASPPVQQALNNAYWRSQGLVSLVDMYRNIRQAW